MKTFKMVIVTACLLVASGTLYAQTFGLKGGLNLSNMLIKMEDEVMSEGLKMSPGFHAGFALDIPADDWFSVETGLQVSTKGYRISEKGSGYEFEENTTLYYLNIPVTPKATINTGKIKLYMLAGPYFSFGLYGKTKDTYTYGGETEKETEDIEWGDDPIQDDFKKPDFGLTMGGGILVGAVQMGVTYDLGISNIASNTDYDTKIKNRVLGITCAYWFPKK